MKKKWIKKGSAALLTAAMVLSLFQGTKGTMTVQAAENTAPASEYWTDVEGLKKFSLSSGDSKVGTIIFGLDGAGAAQKWKIVGTDTGIEGDNIILFAATSLANSVFNADSDSIKTYNSTYGNYPEETSVTQVYPNHYGASDLRSKLKGYLSDESYFSTSEVSKMNQTTIYTFDSKNNCYYSVTDKLYIPYGISGTSTVYLGSNTSDDMASGVGIPVYVGETFYWLREPMLDYGSDINSKYALVGYKNVTSNKISNGRAVFPAFDLNLSSVSFASAAGAATALTNEFNSSADMTENTYTLRYISNGTESAVISTDGKSIQVINASGKYLMVQNSIGVYEQEIGSNNMTIDAGDISMDSDVLENFNNCKVWLESTNDGITTAKLATRYINSAEVTDITAPSVGTALDTTAAISTTGVKTTSLVVTWKQGEEAATGNAGYNTTYTASVTLTAEAGYEFASDITVQVNGQNATSVVKNNDGTLTITYEFPATAKAKLLNIITPQAMTVANGTAYSAMNLPSKVNIVTEGSVATEADVEWDTVTPTSGSYDPSVLTEQSVTLNGTVTCPSNIDQNSVNLTTTITVTISAAGIVGAPTADLASGTYTDDQSVALTSTTAGATIYYTTDGSEPTVNGTEYTAPISVTGTEGQSVTTTIKAIAVKAGMQNSIVQTFTYTINIPHAQFTYTYTWSDDNTRCTATRKCTNCEYTDSETVSTTATITQKKTCTLPELTRYVATFKNTSGNGFVTQMKEDVKTADAAGHTSGDWIIDKAATVDAAGSRHKECTVCGTILEKEAIKKLEPQVYKIIDGADSTWTQNTDGSIVIKGNGAFAKFKEVKVDGVVIDSTNYTAAEGSTIITLKADYLKTLSVGDHTFEIVWTDGSAYTNFAVVQNTSDDSSSDNNKDTGKDKQNSTAPKTGDTSNPVLWLILLLASMAGFAGCLKFRKIMKQSGL